MKHSLLLKAVAMVAVFILCFSLLCLFPLPVQASGTDEPFGTSDNDSTTSSFDNQGPESPVASAQQEPEGAGSVAPSDPVEQGSGVGGNTVDIDSTGLPPAETVEDMAEAETQEREISQNEQQEPSEPEVSHLLKSSRTVPGYNVFEVNSFAALAEALSTTSYPSEKYPEKGVYILLTGDVSITSAFMLHRSVEKVVIDGDGLYTLSETNRARSQVSPGTVEVKLKDLNIAGRQFYGLFDNTHGTDVLYIYERVKYTGPQLLWAFNSTAHFYNCEINITAALDPAHEILEAKDVYFFGASQINHKSSLPVFNVRNGGSLTLSPGAELNINITGGNEAVIQTALPQSKLRLEDGASLYIEGSSSQLANSAGLHSIYLGKNASFNWVAHRNTFDYVSVNSSGGQKDAIYLSEGAQFHIAPNGTPDARFIRIDGGNVVIGPGASLSLRAVLYTASYSSAPFHLAAGSSLTVGEAASLTMEIGNRSDLSAGLIYFGGGRQSGFFVGKDATVVIRGNRARGAICFSGANSVVEFTDPSYLEISVTLGVPIYFNNASTAYPCTLTYTDVQQINYWSAGSQTYLNGGRYLRRWAAQTGRFSVKATVTAGGNKGVGIELEGGPLDPLWTPVLDAETFDMNNAQVLSAGKVSINVSTDGSTYQGQIISPQMGVPYSRGTVQLREGLPGADRAVSALAAATPQFYIATNQPVNMDDEVFVWAEYGYVFHHNPPAAANGTLSLSAPPQIQFGTLVIPFADTVANALDTYTLRVVDERSAGNGWQVMASFSGFGNMEKRLNSTLVVNNAPLGKTPVQIAASSGTQMVPLEASLLVPGGDAETGTYTGTITWTVVDAP